MRKFRIGVLVLVPLLFAMSLLSGCAQSGSGNIKVGSVANQTTDFALAGMMLHNGIDMAVKEINDAGGVKGRKIDLSIADAAKDNTTAVNAFNKIYSEKPAAVFLPIYSTQVMAVLPELAKNPVVSFTAASNVMITQQGIKHLFRSRPNDGTVAKKALLAAAKSLGKKKIGLLHVNNEFGNGAAKVQNESAKEAGVTIVGDESYAATDKDMKPQLQKLNAQGAEVIIHWGHPGDTGLVIKQRKELGLKSDLLASVTMVSPAVIALVTPQELDGVYAVVDAVGVPAKHPDAAVKKWAADYKAKYNIDPDYGAFTYYQAMKMLGKAMESGTDLDSLQKAVASIKYTGMANINLAFDAKGDVIQDIALVKFTGTDPNIQVAAIPS